MEFRENFLYILVSGFNLNSFLSFIHGSSLALTVLHVKERIICTAVRGRLTLKLM